MDWTDELRVAKLMEFDTLAEAQAHVDAFIADFPNAFAAPIPPGPTKSEYNWKVNPNAKTLSVDPRGSAPPTEPRSHAAIRIIADALDPSIKAQVLAALDNG